jgi:hypothetical protein
VEWFWLSISGIAAQRFEVAVFLFAEPNFMILHMAQGNGSFPVLLHLCLH